MPRKKPLVKRRAVYWWTEEIAELRRIATRCRRTASRANKNGTDRILRCAECKVAKKALQWAINQSKKENFKRLIQDIDVDVWGKGYQIAMRRLNPPTPSVAQDALTMTRIVDVLFPTHARELDEPIEIGEIPMISEAELKLAVDSLKSGKVPGPDDIPTEALKTTVRACPQLFAGYVQRVPEAGPLLQAVEN